MPAQNTSVVIAVPFIKLSKSNFFQAPQSGMWEAIAR